MVKLRMPKGCDVVSHGSEGFLVENVGWTCEVPPEAAAWLLRTGSGATLADPPVIEEPTGMVRVRHPKDRKASFSCRGQTYIADHNGILEIPAASTAEAASHNFVVIKE
jgi:hypothetical protein